MFSPTVFEGRVRWDHLTDRFVTYSFRIFHLCVVSDDKGQLLERLKQQDSFA